MPIWVDADACPGAIREILFRAAERRGVDLTLVANQPLRVPRSPHIRAVQVAQGFDVADDTIVQRLEPGDLVITADIPLAAAVIDGGGTALNPRGTLYTEENIRDHQARRDLLASLRDQGTLSGGPPPLDRGDVQRFANALDRWLTRSA